MTYDDITAYASKIGIAFTRGDVEQILRWAREDNQDDLRCTVWEFLDTYEGISHSRDPDFWSEEEHDDY